MDNRTSSSSNTSVGWIDVVAILAVIGILAFALGEISTGRVREFSLRKMMDASRTAQRSAPVQAPGSAS